MKQNQPIDVQQATRTRIRLSIQNVALTLTVFSLAAGIVLGGFMFPVKKSTPAATGAQIFSGTVSVRIEDDFEHQLSRTRYALLTTDGREYSLAAAQHRLESLTSGMRVEVVGTLSRGTIRIQERQPFNRPSATTGSDETLRIIEEPPAIAVSGSKKVGVILFNFASNPIQPITPALVYARMFANPTSAKPYYAATSAEQLTLIGDSGGVPLNPPNPNGDIYVYGWYTINANPANCDAPLWADLARAQATAGALDHLDYQIFAFPFQTSCNWGGVAVLGGNTSWNNGQFSENSLRHVHVHELGHNFGAHHANAARCRDANGDPVPYGPDCTPVGYGDPYDPMGANGGDLYHFNNFNTGQFDWYGPSNMQEITTSGTYILFPIEADSFGTDVRVLRIPTSYTINETTTEGYYYLEYRQPYQPFDNFDPSDPAVNGITLRLAPDHRIGEQSYILDMTPDTLHIRDEALLPGTTFTDSTRGLTVTVTIPPDRLTASVNVSLTCVHRLPYMIPPFAAGTGEGPITFPLTITNNDFQECRSSTFAASSALPAGWTQTPIDPVTIAPRAEIEMMVEITPPAGIPSGNYEFSETITNTDWPSATVTEQGVIIIDSTPPPAPTNLRLNGQVMVGSIPLAWNPAADSESGTRGYRLYHCGGVGCTPDDPLDLGSVTSYTFMTNGQFPQYAFEVTAYNWAGGESNRSNRIIVNVSGGGGGSPTFLKIAPTSPFE